MRLLGETKLAINNLHDRVMTRTKGGITAVLATINPWATGTTNSVPHFLMEGGVGGADGFSSAGAVGTVGDAVAAGLGLAGDGEQLKKWSMGAVQGNPEANNNSYKSLAEKLDLIKAKVLDMDCE